MFACFRGENVSILKHFETANSNHLFDPTGGEMEQFLSDDSEAAAPILVPRMMGSEKNK